MEANAKKTQTNKTGHYRASNFSIIFFSLHLNRDYNIDDIIYTHRNIVTRVPQEKNAKLLANADGDFVISAPRERLGRSFRVD